jgi:hypothetical protein
MISRVIALAEGGQYFYVAILANNKKCPCINPYWAKTMLPILVTEFLTL